MSLIGILIGQVFLPGFPKELILIQAGAEFGVILGSIINWLGMVIGAQVAYETVRRSVETGGRFSDILERYPELPSMKYLESKGNRGLFMLRLIPNSPNDVLSLVSGGLFLHRKGFFLVSVITAIPYAIVFAYFGSIGSDFINTRILLAINFALFGVFLIVLLVVYTRKQMLDNNQKNHDLPSSGLLSENSV